MGLWIWSMHFTRMLAFDLPVPVACPPAHGSPLAFNRRSCLSPPHFTSRMPVASLNKHLTSAVVSYNRR